MLFQLLLLASTASATCTHGLSMFKKRAETAEGGVEVGNFGYGPLNGPFNWATIAAENEACKAGRNQSPINIDGTVSAMAEKPVLDIPTQEVEFENLGTTIEVIVNGTTTVAGEEFRLVQFHMHTPSEHHVNGEYHPLEVHMVHQGVADANKVAVMALMFQVSATQSSSIIRSLASSVEAIRTPGTKVSIPAGIDFADVLNKVQSSEIMQYTGSLTTPPCTEGVTFMIVKDPLDISVADYNSIKSVVKFNSRFIQNALGGENMIEVGNLAGTANALQVPVVAAEEAASNDTAKPIMTVGQRFTVTELHGQPTAIAAVVVARRQKKY